MQDEKTLFIYGKMPIIPKMATNDTPSSYENPGTTWSFQMIR